MLFNTYKNQAVRKSSDSQTALFSGGWLSYIFTPSFYPVVELNLATPMSGLVLGESGRAGNRRLIEWLSKFLVNPKYIWHIQMCQWQNYKKIKLLNYKATISWGEREIVNEKV